MESISSLMFGMVAILGGFAVLVVIGVIVWLRWKASGQMRGF